MIKTDRRITKTKKLLSQALMDLILEKGYNNVTIQDILNKSNVGRSTFYWHYENKDQLFLDGPENLGKPLFNKDVSSIDFQTLCTHIYSHKRLAKAVIGKNSGSIIIDFLKKKIEKGLNESFAKHYNQNISDKKELQYLSKVTASAITALLTTWVQDDFYYTNYVIEKKCEIIVNSIMIN